MPLYKSRALLIGPSPLKILTFGPPPPPRPHLLPPSHAQTPPSPPSDVPPPRHNSPEDVFMFWQEEQAFHMVPRREQRSSLSGAESQSISANIDLITKLRRLLEKRDAETCFSRIHKLGCMLASVYTGYPDAIQLRLSPSRYALIMPDLLLTSQTCKLQTKLYLHVALQELYSLMCHRPLTNSITINRPCQQPSISDPLSASYTRQKCSFS